MAATLDNASSKTPSLKNNEKRKARRKPPRFRSSENGFSRPSRSAKKRASSALQKLGEDLTTMTPATRQELDLPEDLIEALAAYDNIKSREGKRRQKQYIGKIMRRVDANAIARALISKRDQIAGGPEWLAMAKNYTGLLLTVPEKDLNRVLKRFLGLTVPGMLGESQPEALKKLRALALKAREENPMEDMLSGAGPSRELFDTLASLLPTEKEH